MSMNNCLLDMYEDQERLMIVISGEIDHHSAVAVRNEIDAEILRVCPKKAVMDLSGIDFMDSSGLGLIMGRYSKMRAIGGELSLLDPNERILRIFTLAGLERIVRIEYTSDSGKEKENEN